MVPPDTGSLDGDLRALLQSFRTAVEISGRQTVLALLAEPENADTPAVRSTLFALGDELVDPLLERARHRGELGDARVPFAVVQLPLDLARHKLLTSGALPDGTLDAIIDKIALPLMADHSRTQPGPGCAHPETPSG